MRSLIQNVVDFYLDIDPRVEKYMLVRSAYPMLVMIASYLLFCCKVGPWLMESRQPYKLKNTLLVYNLLQVILSCFLAYKGTLMWSQFNLFCQPIDYSPTPFMMKAISIGWWYLFAKFTELLDTVFFVLRKKHNQVSFLHLFHHTIMPIISWAGMRYIAGGHGTLVAVINSYIHILMYTYYLMAGLGPQYKKYLWWKKHVTLLQIAQFGFLFLHNFFPLFTSCSYPKVLHVIILSFTGFFFYLFSSFYIHNYVRKSIKETNGFKRD